VDGKLFADLFGQGLDLFDQGGHDHIPGDLRLSVAAAGAAGCGDQPAYSTAGLDVLRERGYGRREARSAPVARPLQTSGPDSLIWPRGDGAGSSERRNA